MSTRVSPLERVRADIDDLFASERELGEVLEEVARLGVRLLMQTAIEAEVTEFLGRERYAHGERARAGSRNGHCPTTVKTTTGPVTIDRPKLRGTDEVFVPAARRRALLLDGVDRLAGNAEAVGQVGLAPPALSREGILIRYPLGHPRGGHLEAERIDRDADQGRGSLQALCPPAI